MSVGAARLAEQQAAASSAGGHDDRPRTHLEQRADRQHRQRPRPAGDLGDRHPRTDRRVSTEYEGLPAAYHVTLARLAARARRLRGERMAATELTRTVASTGRAPWLPAGPGALWLHAYAGVWLATLAAAALVALVGRPLALPARRLLGLALSAQRNPPPHVGHVLVLAAHNIPIAAWPLLLGVLGAHRHRLARHVADGVLLACIIANTLPVGAALGAYGTAVLAYIPQLPLEWGGLALGASAWLMQRRRALSVREGLALLALIAWRAAVRRRRRDRRRAAPMRAVSQAGPLSG